MCGAKNLVLHGRWLLSALAIVALVTGACRLWGPHGENAVEIGRHGVGDGCFHYPRAILSYAGNTLLVIDKTGRIQRLSADGRTLAVWQVPDASNGTPTGAALDREGGLLVADTHYSRILRYSADGTSWTQFGRSGEGPGELVYPTDVAVDSRGNIYVTNYRGRDRVVQFRRDGTFVKEWGDSGNGPGQFQRPMALAILNDEQIVVADSCNHRVQRFDLEGRFLGMWGSVGHAQGQLNYPYDIATGPRGEIYVCEFGNHRISKFARDGRFLATLGGPGSAPGQFRCPWGVALDALGRLYVADTYNHRIQRFDAGAI